MTESGSAPYRGRFAPSPTGPLHFGSLIAATGSYLQARQQGGEWYVRIEDIDPPREQQGAADGILFTLEAFGFQWDGPVSWQSQHGEYYRAVLADLLAAGLAYRCDCSRRALGERAQHLGNRSGVYDGFCRSRQIAPQRRHAIRFLSDGPPITLVDLVQGRLSQHVVNEVGDFILLRADGLYAYQLAVVVDDARQGITEVVRGSDLLNSTPRQILLQQGLAYPTPGYLHLPVALNTTGQKLSKQNLAPAIRPQQRLELVWQALHFLGQQPPRELLDASLDDCWQWATTHWQVARIPRTLGLLFQSGTGNDEQQ